MKFVVSVLGGDDDMSLPEQIYDWLRGHYHDKKDMEELLSVLTELQSDKRNPNSVTERVEWILKCRDLTDTKVADVAGLLHMSERSLSRKLRAENIDFSSLLREERKRRYLKIRARGEFTFAQMAPVLGFADGKSVRRASKHWALKD